MIEQALYFVIGFLAATLAAIATLPALARRAARLSEARYRLQAPATEKEALAQRDALRAGYAVEIARIERRAERAEEQAIALRAEGGGKDVRLVTLQAEAADRAAVLLERDAEIQKLTRETRALEATVAASQTALNDLSVQRDRALAAEAEAVLRASSLEADSHRDRARIAILAARCEHTESRLEQVIGVANASAEKAALAEERLRAALAASDPRSARDADRARMMADLEARLAASEAAREQTLIEMGRQLVTLSDRDAELRTVRAKVKELEALTEVRERPTQAIEDAPSPAESLAATLASTEEALKAARSERDALQREIGELAASFASSAPASEQTTGDVALRVAIERLGREVATLFTARADPDEVERGRKDLLSFSRRDAAGAREENADEGRRHVAGSRALER